MLSAQKSEPARFAMSCGWTGCIKDHSYLCMSRCSMVAGLYLLPLLLTQRRRIAAGLMHGNVRLWWELDVWAVLRRMRLDVGQRG
jgi:hypothetical protein